MNVVILCGGYGTRLSEETQIKPKPMVEIGDKPILHHIMKLYSKFSIKDFNLALGYKQEYIKDYFYSYHNRFSDYMINLKKNSIKEFNNEVQDWNVSLIDTGKDTMTGGRLLRLKKHLYDNGTFMLTYGDGLADVNINKLISFHKSHGKIATITAVRPPVRFGELDLNKSDEVLSFQEKPQAKHGWINGGFFVFEPKIFDYIDGDHIMLEREPLEKLTKENELVAFKHNGFWQCMDNIRDKEFLTNLWENGNAPWI